MSYILWRDALHSMDEQDIKDIEPVNLQEVGFLVRETHEAVTLALEAPVDHGTSTRMWLCIPKCNILLRRDADLTKAFPAKRKKRRRLT